MFHHLEMELSNVPPKIKEPTLLMNAPYDITTPLKLGPRGIGGRKVRECILRYYANS